MAAYRRGWFCSALLVVLMHKRVSGLSATDGWQYKSDTCPSECATANIALVVDGKQLFHNAATATGSSGYGPSKFWPTQKLPLILADPVDGCTAGVKSPAPSGGGDFALVVKRGGGCAFDTKSWFAQQQGAKLVIILNTKPEPATPQCSPGTVAELGFACPANLTRILTLMLPLNGDDGQGGDAADSGASALEQHLAAHAAAGTQAWADVTCGYSANGAPAKLRSRGGAVVDICPANSTTTSTTTTATTVVPANVLLEAAAASTKKAYADAGCDDDAAKPGCAELKKLMDAAAAAAQTGSGSAGGGGGGSNMGLIIGISATIGLILCIVLVGAVFGPQIADGLARREMRVRPAKTTMNALQAVNAFNLGKQTDGSSGWATKGDKAQPAPMRTFSPGLGDVAGLTAPSAGKIS